MDGVYGSLTVHTIWTSFFIGVDDAKITCRTLFMQYYRIRTQTRIPIYKCECGATKANNSRNLPSKIKKRMF